MDLKLKGVKGKTGKKNIKDIYKYKSKKLEESVLDLEEKIITLNKKLEQLECEKKTIVEELEESHYRYNQNFFYIGEIQNIRIQEIEEGVFNKTKTGFLKVHKDDFNKVKECALKSIIRDTIHSYLYKDVERVNYHPLNYLR